MSGNDDRPGGGPGSDEEPRIVPVAGGETPPGTQPEAGDESPRESSQESSWTGADAAPAPAEAPEEEGAPIAEGTEHPEPGLEAERVPAPGEELPDLQQTIERLGEELEDLKRNEAEHRDAMLRARAEMENLRKRTERDLENYRKYALEHFVRELLPILDSMEMGLQSAAGSESVAGLQQGMELTVKMFADLLRKFGVDAIDPVGSRFDPERHEAVSMQEKQGEAEGEEGESRVVAVMQKGYALGDRLIRPARVVVAR